MPDTNFQNRTLYHGDNLKFLREMNSGTVHLIATDPPFNKSRDFHATPDSLASGARFSDRWKWDDDVHPEWTDQIEDDWPAVHAVIEAAKVAYGMDMAAFLCWLGVRLMEMRRILRDDGSIYLHIDQTAHAYVKALMDGIFGKKNFLNEIIWCYKSGGASPQRYFSRKHDTILMYTRSDRYTFNPQKEKSYNRDLKPYRFAGVREYQDEVGWYTLVGMKDYWLIDMVGRTSAERTGYPTQKPLALYERIIKASSNPGDIVLDPFCGCATTPIAAERLERQWVGIDIWDKAHEQVLNRLVQDGLAVPTEEEKRDADTEEGSRPLLAFGDIHYSTTPPTRTDDQEIAAPNLKLKLQRAVEPWQRLSNREMRSILAVVQSVNRFVGCAGCGRMLEIEFMHLDHIQPKSDGGENHITNRVLLCSPCNNEKSDDKTIRGLHRANKRSGWMQDEPQAKDMRDRALTRASWIRDQWGTEDCQEFIRQARERVRPLR